MERYLAMLEVSQKQSYIFGSNKLKDNIRNSAVIAWIMSPEYFEEVMKDPKRFNQKDNLVYSGGGHIVLEFAGREQAVQFIRKITFTIHRDYPGIEVFAAVKEYEEDKNPGENLKLLTAALEEKKSLRLAAFHQGSFGIEEIDPKTLKPLSDQEKRNKEKGMPAQEQKIDRQLTPDGYEGVEKFEELGGSKGDSNFIAVVHIDGNAMGKRVQNLYEKNKHADWETYKKKLQNFSTSIDRDFKDSYREMTKVVQENLEKGALKELKLEGKHFPVRRIITAGDDICFVSEGRIGIECAVSFIKALNKKKNAEDGEGYSACGGVAIVHQKYPFYKAYELAEMLCSNAKKFGASLSKCADQSGKDVSAIDWHIEFGQMKDSLEEIRKDYITETGERLEMRPYLVATTDPEIWENEESRRYENFKKLITNLQTEEIAYARGKLKELRSALKKGKEAAEIFVKFNKIEDITLEAYQGIYKKTETDKVATGIGLERTLFLDTNQKTEKRSTIFDALEVWDTYLGFEEEKQ